MDLNLLTILRCPTCYNKLVCYADRKNEHGNIIEGKLICANCNGNYPIIRSIPRFIKSDNYASSFGYQWNLYKYTQVDKYSHLSNSEKRFFSETNWLVDAMKDDWILEVGCGNGRFLDICSRAKCQVVGVDVSSAIDAAGELFSDRDNVHLVQASIYELPFEPESFNKCYCIGVIQHTPDSEKSINALTRFVKADGQLALTIYERKPWTKLCGKYLARVFTKRMNHQFLLGIIKVFSLILFPLTEFLYRLPILGKLFQFIIPYANYVGMKNLSLKQRYEWGILDTFDMLSPAYDNPMTESEVIKCLNEAGMKSIKRLPNQGVNVIAIK